MTADLVARLLAAIDATEADARAAMEGPCGYSGTETDDGVWRVGEHETDAERVEGIGITIYDEGGHTAAQARHIARHDPASVIRRCAADRKILDLHEAMACGAVAAAGTPLAGAAKVRLGAYWQVIEALAEGYGIEEET